LQQPPVAPQQANLFAPLDSAPQQVQPQQVQPQQVQQQLQPQVESPLITAFKQRGFDVPAGMDEVSFLDTISQQIDDANQIRDDFQKRQAQQPAQPSLENALPAQPAPVASAQLPSPDAGSFTLSATALSLQQQGLLKKGEGGIWTADDPGLKSYADEANQLEVSLQNRARQLVTDPNQVLAPHMQKVASEITTPLEARLKQLEDQLATERQQAGDAEVDGWLKQNEQQLFFNGDRNQLAPYGQQYNSFAAQVDGMAKQYGKNLSRGDLHNQTLQMMQAAGVTQQIQPAAPVQPEPQPQVPMQLQYAQQQQPQQSFMQQAATTTPQINGNRLTEYPSQQPTGSPQLPTGKGGRPSLAGIIAQQQAGN
jgi:hypothetical protein